MHLPVNNSFFIVSLEKNHIKNLRFGELLLNFLTQRQLFTPKVRRNEVISSPPRVEHLKFCTFAGEREVAAPPPFSSPFDKVTFFISLSLSLWFSLQQHARIKLMAPVCVRLSE